MLGHVCHLHIHFRFKMQWIVLLSMLALAAAQCQPRLSPTDTLTVPSGTLTTWSEAIHAAAAPLAANVDGGFYVVGVFDGHVVHSEGYGFANANDKNTAPSRDSYFRLGSLTKLYTTLLLLTGIAQNHVFADATVRDLLGPTQPKIDAATLRALSAHIAGLPRETPCDDNACNVDTPTMLARLANLTIPNIPYFRAAYSNLGYGIIGHAVAAAFGNADKYESLLQDQVLAPLSATSTTFDVTPDLLARLANGTWVNTPLSDLGWGNPDGGIYSTGADIEQLLAWLTSPSATQTSISPEAKRAWYSPIHFVQQDAAYGMCWEITRNGDSWVYGKAGDIDTWSSQRGFNFGCSVIADAILPNFSNATSAFVSQYLHDVQTNRPAASNPSSLVGMYSGTTSETGPISFNVTANAQGQLSLRVTFSLQIDVLLFPNQNNQNNDEFQMHFPLDAPYDCVTESVLGWDGAIVLIQGDSLSLPNLLVGAAFSKQ